VILDEKKISKEQNLKKKFGEKKKRKNSKIKEKIREKKHIRNTSIALLFVVPFFTLSVFLLLYFIFISLPCVS
jgi:hypothetical protein